MTLPRRRGLLAAVGSGAVAGLSGCLGTLVPDVDEEGDALVAELRMYDRRPDPPEVVADTHHDHWHGGLPDISVGETRRLAGEFKDHNHATIPVGDDESYQLQARTERPHDAVSVDSHGDYVAITGEAASETTIVFQLADGVDTNWEAPPISIVVTSA